MTPDEPVPGAELATEALETESESNAAIRGGGAQNTGELARAVAIGHDTIHPVDIEQFAVSREPVPIDPGVWDVLAAARALVDEYVVQRIPAYGITRGLGALKDQEIPDALQSEYQLFVLESHDAAVGEYLSEIETRAVILTRLAVMSRGNSGASRSLFQGLRDLIDHDVTPAVPAEGSVGAADLAALASIGAVLVGRGYALTGQRGGDEEPVGPERAVNPATAVRGDVALAEAELEPITLGPKDGLALVGANAASVGLASLVSARLDRLCTTVNLTATLTLEAVDGNVTVFDERVGVARPHPGQIRSARQIQAFLQGGDLAAGRRQPGTLQDPISFRTVAQVNGTLLEQADVLRDILTVELNARPENPLIDLEAREILSNGNFSTIRLALAVDSVRLALAHAAMLSERRCAAMIMRLRTGRTLIDQVKAAWDDKRPLVPVILANTASALVARIQHLAGPVSHLGSIVGDGLEDHNAQAYSGVRLTQLSLDLVETLVSVELILAAGTCVLREDYDDRTWSPVITELFAGTLDILDHRQDNTTAVRIDQAKRLLLSTAASLPMA